MSMSKRCDIFPNSRAPVYEYRLRFVKIIPNLDPEQDSTEQVMFTATKDMGERGADRAMNALRVCTNPPKSLSKDPEEPKPKDFPSPPPFRNAS